MKKVICLLVIFIICVLPFSVFAAYDGTEDNVIRDVQVQVHQQNTSYAGMSNTSAIIEAPYSLGVCDYPQSLCMTNSSLSVLNGDTIGTDIEVTITYPGMSAAHVVYVAVCNTFGAFNNQASLGTYFQWSDAARGYMTRTGLGGSFGYYNPNNYLQYNVPTKANRNATHTLRESGSTFSNPTWTNLTPDAIDVGTANIIAPQMGVGSGTAYADYYFLNASNNVAIYKIVLDRDSNRTNWPYSTLVLNCPASGNNKAKVTQSNTGLYLHSAVFVPLVIAYDTTNFSADYLNKLDSMISELVSIDSGIESLGISLNQIISILGSGDITVIDALDEILTRLMSIQQSLVHLNNVGGSPTGSAVQYIEYYMRNVANNTNSMVAQLDNILATLNQISNIIDDANDKAENIASDSEDIHEQEQEIFEDANDAIGSTVISSFVFDGDTAVGMGRVGIDFTNLWNALGTWHNVYIFSMTLTLAFTIIRFSSARSRAKNRDNKNKGE